MTSVITDVREPQTESRTIALMIEQPERGPSLVVTDFTGECGSRASRSVGPRAKQMVRSFRRGPTTGEISSALAGIGGRRDLLILEHLPQVRSIARRIHGKLPGTVCLDDLISSGIVGLIAAIDKFDPSSNVKLKSFAEYRIRGAMLDMLRQSDWAPRRLRRMGREIGVGQLLPSSNVSAAIPRTTRSH